MSSDEEKYLKEFGKSFKILHSKISKKSLRIIAYEAGIQPSILSRLENGRRMPNIYTLKRIASAFYMSVDEFLKEIEKNIPDKVKNFDI